MLTPEDEGFLSTNAVIEGRGGIGAAYVALVLRAYNPESLGL